MNNPDSRKLEALQVKTQSLERIWTEISSVRASWLNSERENTILDNCRLQVAGMQYEAQKELESLAKRTGVVL